MAQISYRAYTPWISSTLTYKLPCERGQCVKYKKTTLYFQTMKCGQYIRIQYNTYSLVKVDNIRTIQTTKRGQYGEITTS